MLHEQACPTHATGKLAQREACRELSVTPHAARTRRPNRGRAFRPRNNTRNQTRVQHNRVTGHKLRKRPCRLSTRNCAKLLSQRRPRDDVKTAKAVGSSGAWASQQNSHTQTQEPMRDGQNAPFRPHTEVDAASSSHLAMTFLECAYMWQQHEMNSVDNARIIPASDRNHV